MKNIEITKEHLAEIANKELTFGSACKAKATIVSSKSITYQPSTQLIRVYADNKLIDSSTEEQEMIDLYNSIFIR